MGQIQSSRRQFLHYARDYCALTSLGTILPWSSSAHLFANDVQPPTSWPLFRGDAHATGVAHTTLPASLDTLWDYGRFGSFTRSPIRLRVKDHEIEGFCHVPPDGAPMKRLEHGEHPFISLTTVLVTSPDGQSTAPFLAVNRTHILAVQEVDLQEGEEPDAVSSGATSEA